MTARRDDWTPDDGTPEEGRARALGRLLVDRPAPSEAPPAWQRLGERNLLQAARGQTRQPAGWPRRLAWASVLVAGAALLAASFWGPVSSWALSRGGLASSKDVSDKSAETLTFAVRGGAESGGKSSGIPIEGSSDQAASLDFSDGSAFTVHARSVARIAASDAQGATLVLERGGLDARVTPRSEARWRVRAGDYEVQVVGTVFTTLWHPERQSFAVLLREGAVRIVGPEVRGAVELRAGQRFDASTGGGWRITPLDTSDAAAPADDARDEPSAPRATELAELGDAADSTPAVAGEGLVRPKDGKERAPVAVSKDKGASNEKQRPTWTALVNQGQFDQVLAEAEERGVEQCFTRCTAEDLRALGDAARYTGRVALARDALLALRTRAPGEASRAAYFLGSLSESRGQAANALEWYTRSLDESSNGPLAAEARAGRMRTLLALGRREEARSQAQEYLRLHPTGVAAERARRVSSGGR